MLHTALLQYIAYASFTDCFVTATRFSVTIIVLEKCHFKNTLIFTCSVLMMADAIKLAMAICR